MQSKILLKVCDNYSFGREKRDSGRERVIARSPPIATQQNCIKILRLLFF